MNSMNPIAFDHVWKRYQLGSTHDSLRDAIPALLKRLAGRDGHEPREDEFWALQDVSFSVRKSETLGIIGPNGAGKSTILKLLSRITHQTRGSLRVRGRLSALIELGGGFHTDLTGAENIYLQGTMLGLARRRIRGLFDRIVAFSELDAFLQTPVKRYSSGMVVRLGFAIAAHVQPEVLLLDEVLSVGDLAFEQRCFGRISELKAQGTTMIFVSHDLDAVQKLCDRVVLLRDGRVASEGEPAEIIRRYRTEVISGAPQPSRDGASTSADGTLAIRQVLLRDALGRPVETARTGQPLRIEVSLCAFRPIRQPTLRIGIERLDGLLCHATSSRGLALLPDGFSGEATVSVEYPALNLLPNVYQVTVEVFEASNPIPLAALRQGRYFQVASDHHEQGTLHLEHRWVMTP